MGPRGGMDASIKDEREDVLTAVLLADSFASAFQPVTTDVPKCLLPLCNVPMIEYSLDWLSTNGVQEVVVFCCAHAVQVHNYISNSKWSSYPGMGVRIVSSEHCPSAGEALRLIYGQDIIHGDFVLVHGDTVCTVDLKGALAAHKERRKTDKHAIMTTLMKRVNPEKRRAHFGMADDLVVATEPWEQQLLHYEQIPDLMSTGFVFPSSDLDRFKEVRVRADLMDTHIDICSPEVLFLFHENFDFQDIRADFIQGVLGSDIMGDKVHIYEVPQKEYAARVLNLRAYASITQDVLHRWTFPYTPDNNWAFSGDERTSYTYDRMSIYMETSQTRLSRTCTVGRDSMVGAGTVIGEETNVMYSVLGQNCKLGTNCSLDHCIVMDGVVIGDECELSYCFICSGVRVGNGCVVGAGSVLSIGCALGPGFQVKPHTRIALQEQVLDFDGSSDEEGLETHLGYSSPGGSPPGLSGRVPFDKQLSQGEDVGIGGRGFVWRSNGEWANGFNSLVPYDAERMKAEIDPSEVWVNGRPPLSSDAADGGGAEAELDRSVAGVGGGRGDEYFAQEVKDTFKRGAAEGHEHDNIVLEINSLRMAYNKTFSECGGLVLGEILLLALAGADSTPKGLLKVLLTELKKWASLLKRFVYESDDGVEILLTLEEVCEESNGIRFRQLFPHIIKNLYDLDVVDEDAFLQWAEEKSNADAEDRKYLDAAAKFIQWLQEADEEDDSDG